MCVIIASNNTSAHNQQNQLVFVREKVGKGYILRRKQRVNISICSKPFFYIKVKRQRYRKSCDNSSKTHHNTCHTWHLSMIPFGHLSSRDVIFICDKNKKKQTALHTLHIRQKVLSMQQWMKTIKTIPISETTVQTL